jgi:Ser/Thr protein kinase RdoA (MazF antagonist)
MQAFDTLGYKGQVRRLKRLAATALAQYALPPVRLTVLNHAENATFRAKDPTGKCYILRISRPGQHTLEEVRSEMIWLAALRRDTSLGVPEPVATRAGDLAVVVGSPGVPEDRICVLFHWIERHALNTPVNPRRMAQVGVFAAHLHNHAARFTPPAGFCRGRVDSVEAEGEAAILGRVAAVRPPEDVATLRATIAHIRAMLEPLGQGPDAYGLIHADLHPWNYRFYRDELRAVDFDDCGYGPYLYDLAVPLYELEERPQIAKLRAALLAGYQSVRPLPAHHEAVLDALVMLRRINLILWQVDSREHPAFRDNWEADVDYDMDKLRAEFPA